MPKCQREITYSDVERLFSRKENKKENLSTKNNNKQEVHTGPDMKERDYLFTLQEKYLLLSFVCGI